MEDMFLLNVIKREKSGTKDAAALRKKKLIPAVVYGHKKESIAVAADEREFLDVVNKGNRLGQVQINDTKETVMIKALQYDDFGRAIIHADFVRVDVDEIVKVVVPIALKGTAPGTSEGGIIEERASEVEIECKVSNVPESIELSIKELQLDESLHASDIVLPEGIKLVTSGDVLIVACHEVAATKEAEETEITEEATQTPEVIGKPEKDETEPKDDKS